MRHPPFLSVDFDAPHQPTLAMTLTRLDYDKCTYAHNLAQSVGPGQYWVKTPMPHCEECISDDPRIRLNKHGNSKCADRPLIDVDSEVKNITRRASNCPLDKYVSRNKPHCAEIKHMRRCRDEVMMSEDTRYSNPPCTLRGTHNGFNRWEWLCQNPQERVGMPFDVQINSRILSKDNHRPVLPEPIDPAESMPPLNHDDTMVTGLPPKCMMPMDNLPMTHWRKCTEIAKY